MICLDKNKKALDDLLGGGFTDLLDMIDITRKKEIREKMLLYL